MNKKELSDVSQQTKKKTPPQTPNLKHFPLWEGRLVWGLWGTEQSGVTRVCPALPGSLASGATVQEEHPAAPEWPSLRPGSGWCALEGATSVLALPHGGHQPPKLSRKEGVAAEAWVTERGPPGTESAASTCPTSRHSKGRIKGCWIGSELPHKLALKRWKGRQVTCMFW